MKSSAIEQKQQQTEVTEWKDKLARSSVELDEFKELLDNVTFNQNTITLNNSAPLRPEDIYEVYADLHKKREITALSTQDPNTFNKEKIAALEAFMAKHSANFDISNAKKYEKVARRKEERDRCAPRMAGNFTSKDMDNLVKICSGSEEEKKEEKEKEKEKEKVPKIDLPKRNTYIGMFLVSTDGLLYHNEKFTAEDRNYCITEALKQDLSSTGSRYSREHSGKTGVGITDEVQHWHVTLKQNLIKQKRQMR